MALDYRTIFSELNKAKIDYLVVGGLAVNFYGIPRMTYDMDLMIALNSENISKLVSRLTDWGYRPRVPANPKDLIDEKERQTWISEKNMKAFSFFHEKEAIGEIDILIDLPAPYEEFRKRAMLFDLEGTKVPVISIQDLIELKSRAGRQQDLSDVQHLKGILGEE